jgi:hypothetical protein
MKFYKSTKFWVAVIVAILAVSAVAIFVQSRSNTAAITANVYLDGELLRTIDLANVREPYIIELDDEHGGTNTITVERGRIRVTEANCPDGICIRRGWSSDGATPIVCLPHKLVIEVVGVSSNLDAVA